MSRNITVFCSASKKLSSSYTKLAEAIGEILVDNRYSLVYGGDTCGLMGKIAETMKRNSMEVIGVCIEKMYNEGRFYRRCDRIVLTENLSERKQQMIDLSEVIIVLPGGIGTINELLEVLVLIHLGLVKKKVIIINYMNFFGKFFAFIDDLIEKEFIAFDINNQLNVIENIDELSLYL